MTLKELFDFVVDPTINQENIEVSTGFRSSRLLFVPSNETLNFRITWIEWLN